MDEKEIKFLYKLVKNFQNELTTTRTEQLIRTSPFVRKYDALRKLVKKEFPDVKKYAKRIPIQVTLMNPSFEIGQFSTVKMETNSLVDFLESKLDNSEKIIKDILGTLTRKLRATFREAPKNEKDVQNNVDVVLNVSDFKYLREKITIPYSSKSFIPDFTFEPEKTALEIKICNRDHKEKELVDEINADIKAYKTKYEKLIFLIYDLGFIRDVEQFKQDIDNQEDIYVEIIKH